MIIAKGAAVLEISGSVIGQPAMIYPTLVWDDKDAILIDTGWQMPLIVEAMEKVGVSLNRLTKVILTHQDLDHISGLPGILKSAEQKIEVIAHEVEKPYIEGEKPLVKANPNLKRELQKTLGEEIAAKVEAVFRNPPTSNVDQTLADGEVLPYCGGITVIHTPGHTPGHISLYLHTSKVLVAGDALNTADGRLFGPNPIATEDLGQAVKSLAKLLPYDIEQVVCYHGGVCTGNIAQQLIQLTQSQ